MRDMLFISHANPEDNEFARWLALQLAKEGYPVWCDLTQLLGGEDFWRDIEQAIRERTIKFLYVLSKASNVKPGPRRELDLALGVARKGEIQDFVIPLQIDDLPHDETNILIHGITSISFNPKWVAGLKTLLEKLERDRVLKKPNFSPSAVASWWRLQNSADQGVRDQPEDYLSNWFPIGTLPEYIYFHTLQRSTIGPIEIPEGLPYPAFRHNQYLVSFAKAEDFEDKLGSFVKIGTSNSFLVTEFLDGKNKTVASKFVTADRRRDFVYRLLRMAWERMISARGLLQHQMANGNLCFYFPMGLIDRDTIYFTGVNEKKTYRIVVGYKTVKTSTNATGLKRFWHFGIQAKPIVYPACAYIVKSHVLFSDDGSKIWENDQRLHIARRKQCKDWWNPDWRDRLLATASWLANEEGRITVELGSDVTVVVLKDPLIFTSPVSYTDPEGREPLADIIGEAEQEEDRLDEIDDETDEDQE